MYRSCLSFYCQRKWCMVQSCSGDGDGGAAIDMKIIKFHQPMQRVEVNSGQKNSKATASKIKKGV